MGPDLTGIFVQSNFGIVTAMQVELMPVPEWFESFVIRVQKDSGLEFLIETVRKLRQQGTLTSLVHIGNATRSLITTRTCPAEYKDKLISCEDAIKLMSSPVLKVGYWIAAGGIYGTKDNVQAKKRRIKKAVKTFGNIAFFHDEKISRIGAIAGLPFVKKTGLGNALHESMRWYSHVHGLMKGVPSDEPLNNIQWRTENYDDMGLIWYAPTVPATAVNVRKVVKIADEAFKKFRFEMPLTITFVKPYQVIGVLSISFNKRNSDEKMRAYDLYGELKANYNKEGIYPYRSGILGMEQLEYHHQGKKEVFQMLKRTFDPNNIIAPGRYGI